MVRPLNICAATLACALAVVSGSSFAQTPTFDLTTVPTADLNTAAQTGVSLDANGISGIALTNSPVTATFSDPGSSGDFYFTTNGGVAGLSAPVILSDSGGNGTATSDVLNITFSQAIGSFAFNFGLGNIASTLAGSVIPIPGDTLNVSFLNSAGTVIGTQSLTTTTANDTGLFSYNGAFGAISGVSLSATTSAAEQGVLNYATVNIEAVPEPTTWALMAAGLLAMGGIARRRRQ